MKTISLIVLVLFASGCATVSKTVTGPGGYKYEERIRAIGGSSIEKATQTFGGTLEVYGEDGKLAVKASLDSQQKSEGVTSDAQAIFEGWKLLGSLVP